MAEMTTAILCTQSLREVQDEEGFVREFRAAALPSAACAAIAGALLFAAFLVICLTLEEHSARGIALRAALTAYLAAVAYGLWRRSPFCVLHYVPIAATASGIALAGTVALIAFQSADSEMTAVQASPAIMFGISLHYAFLRLPMRVAAGIGWAVAVAALFWAPAVSGGSELVRNAVYLAFANLFGMVFSRLVENRERELYSQRRKLEAAEFAARERQAAAEEANQQKTRLIAAVSHDLRQPMTAALSYLEVSRTRLHSGNVNEALVSTERARAAVEMLGETLDHLLTAARYDSGTEALNLGFVELMPLLRGVYDTVVTDAEGRGVALKVRLPRTRLVLNTDARSFTRVLSNLVSNAIKFTDPRCVRGSKVLVSARLRGNVCRIDVIDNGIGIQADQCEEIWKPYVQLNNAERDRERGLGLGLFLVKQIIDQLPGHGITMQSRAGHGSRFTLTVPATAITRNTEHYDIARVPASTAELSTLRDAYVFLLEDDRDTRLGVVAMLEAWGIQVTSGATLTDILSQHADSDRLVDALICDYRLAGGTNGVDAIATLRDRLGYAPHAVLVTGEPDIAPIRARAGPETTVLHKPFPPDSLAKPLLRAVRAARLLEEG